MLALFSFNLLSIMIGMIIAKREGCLPDSTKCPFASDKELQMYYSKGLASNSSQENTTFIHCVNEYYTCGHIIKNIDSKFQQSSGVFIGSSIDLFTIKDNLKELQLPFEKQILDYTQVSGQDAEDLLTRSPLSLNKSQINLLNKKVYALRYEKMMSEYSPKRITPSIELALLAFYVKYYGHPIIEETKTLIKEAQWENISYYISTMKGPYRERKLLSLVLDSFKASIDPFYHIGFLFDRKIFDKANWDKEKRFISDVAKELNVKYTIRSSTESLAYNKSREEINKPLNDYSYTYMKEGEKLQRAIDSFLEVFQPQRKVFDVYSQNILFIFINNKTEDNSLNLSVLYDNRISIYLIGMISNQLSIENLEKFAGQYASVIPLTSFNQFSEDKAILFKMLKAGISNQIEVFNLKEKEPELTINNITVIKPSSHRYFLIKPKSTEIVTFHLRMLYQKRIPIDMNIFISSALPYPDYYNNTNMHLGLSVKYPFMNYATNKPFYVGVFTNELNYSLIIAKCKETEDCSSPSNGLYQSNKIELIKSRYYSFQECLKRTCTISIEELFSKYSRGIMNTYNDNSLFLYDNKYYFNTEIFNCLHENYYCGYIKAKQTQNPIVPEYGVLVGLGLNLSEYHQIQLLQSVGLSRLMINKLTPFLSNDDLTAENWKSQLNAFNLLFNSEELRRIDKNTMIYTFKIVEKAFGPCFDTFSDDVKYSLVLNQFNSEKVAITPSIIDDICKADDYSSYLNELYDKNKDEGDQDFINMQAMLIQFSACAVPAKSMISIVVGKSLIANEFLPRFISQFNELSIALSYYDCKSKRVVTVGGFNDKKREIGEALKQIKEETVDNEVIDLDIVLKHQSDLFKYYDYGFKKIILLFTHYLTDVNSWGTKSITLPSNETLSQVRDQAIELIQLTNQNDAPDEEHKVSRNSNWLSISKKVYYTLFDDISLNELFKVILKLHIPITQLKPIVTDLVEGEYSFFRFYYDSNNTKGGEEGEHKRQIKFIFDSNNVSVFISKLNPYPSIYNNSQFVNCTDKKGNYWLSVPFDDDKANLTFYMTLYAFSEASYLQIEIEECDSYGTCGNVKSRMAITWTFISSAMVILVYGLYNCFIDATMTIKTNIYEEK